MRPSILQSQIISPYKISGTGVDEKNYQVPFRFNGKIDKLTFNLGPMQLTEEEEKKILEAEYIKED